MDIRQQQIYRTKLSNQRTYMAYLRTGFAIAVLAKVYEKVYILYYGIFIIIGSSLQYKMFNDNIDAGTEIGGDMMDNMPIIYGLIAIITIWFQFKHR